MAEEIKLEQANQQIRVSSFNYRGKRVQFFISREHDYIQGNHASGRFYELELLERLLLTIPNHATIIDVGANVGNHTIFFGMFKAIRRIYPFEPNPELSELLKRNVALNKVAGVELSYLPFALGDAEYKALIHVGDLNNWGAGRLVQTEDHASLSAGYVSRVEVRPLDSFHFEACDFIKLDVEGHEIEFLKGAEKTISTFRPTIFLEASKRNVAKVCDILLPIGYCPVDYYCSYLGVLNFLFVPLR